MTVRKRLGEILMQAGVIAEPQLRAALTEQRRWGGPLGRILVDMKLITEESMVQALSHQLNLPAVNLDTRTIPPEVLDLVPGELAEQLSVVPFAMQGKFLDLAMSDPTNIAAIDTLRTRTRLNVRPYLAGPKAIERALARNYGRGVMPADVKRPSVTGVDELSFAARASSPAEHAPVGPVSGTGSHAAIRRAAVVGPHELNDVAAREAELRERVEQLEALVERDEGVLRALLAIIVEKGLVTREELREWMK
jgi:hypothetical protein